MWPDADAPGMAAAEWLRINVGARVLDVKGWPAKYDAADALASGMTREAFLEWAREEVEDEIEEPVSTHDEVVPQELLEPGGVLTEIIRYNLATAPIKQIELALAGAIPLLGTLLGRKFATQTGLRTNIYIVGLAKTGRGKEHARNVNKRIIKAIDQADLLAGESFASGQALMTRVQHTPACLIQLDEYGKLLKALNSRGAGNHQVEITTNLMKLFTSSGDVIQGTEYADQKLRPRIDIPYPCVSLYGTSIPETFWDSIQGDDVASGFLNRHVVVEATNREIEMDYTDKNEAVPASISSWFMAICSRLGNGAGNLQGFNPASPIRLLFDKRATELSGAFQKECLARIDNGQAMQTGDIWARASENVQKLSLIVALSRDPMSATITESDFEWAMRFIRFWVSRTERLIAKNIVISEFHRTYEQISDSIKRSGSNGRTISELSKYSRGFRGMKSFERKSIFENLVMDGIAEFKVVSTVANRGKKREAWVPIADPDDLDNSRQTRQVAT